MQRMKVACSGLDQRLVCSRCTRSATGHSHRTVCIFINLIPTGNTKQCVLCLRCTRSAKGQWLCTVYIDLIPTPAMGICFQSSSIVCVIPTARNFRYVLTALYSEGLRPPASADVIAPCFFFVFSCVMELYFLVSVLSVYVHTFIERLWTSSGLRTVWRLTSYTVCTIFTDIFYLPRIQNCFINS